MKLSLRIWRQKDRSTAGRFVTYEVDGVTPDMSFLEIAELMCLDALHRAESCGGHFRVESQTAEGEARRDDANFCYGAAWEWAGQGQPPALHKEPLAFEYVHLAQRSYK